VAAPPHEQKAYFYKGGHFIIQKYSFYKHNVFVEKFEPSEAALPHEQTTYFDTGGHFIIKHFV
jgi:hypothetical protein